jgi:hypothetical protein
MIWYMTAKITIQKILVFCENAPKSLKEILVHVGAHERSGTTKRALSKLTTLGLLGYTLPNAPTSKNQKRIATQKGKEVIEAARRDKHIK